MKSSSTTIIGAGLAGLSLADALVERGVPAQFLTVIDDADPTRGSACPATMLHPFPGRRMDLRRGQGDAFQRSWTKLEKWTGDLGDEWIKRASMVRPLTDDERGEQLHDSWKRAREDYPELIDVELMQPGDVADSYPGVEPTTPALVYRPAAAVTIPLLLNKLEKALREAGVNFVDARVVQIESQEKRRELIVDDGSKIQADETILAVGPSLDEYFPELDLRRKAGEVAVLDPGQQQLPALVNASKHLLERPDGVWGLGSTYFRDDEWASRDDAGVVDSLKGGVADVVAAIEEADVVELWRGERGVFGSDHMPLVGPVPGEPGLYTFAAFGSKGLLWAPAAAEDLAAELTGAADVISPHMATERMSEDKWVMQQ